jgi:hypothetical protein
MVMFLELLVNLPFRLCMCIVTVTIDILNMKNWTSMIGLLTVECTRKIEGAI